MAQPHDAFDAVDIATVDPKYLYTNSTSHQTPFGAIAELVDNSVDLGVASTWCVSPCAAVSSESSSSSIMNK